MIVQAIVISRFLECYATSVANFRGAKQRKKCGSRPPLVEQEEKQTSIPNISTSKECFSLIHNILHSVKTSSDSYFCRMKLKRYICQKSVD